MSLMAKLVNAVRRSPAPRPRFGVLLSPRKEDALRDYPADGLTPSRLVSILREADGGSPDVPKDRPQSRDRRAGARVEEEAPWH